MTVLCVCGCGQPTKLVKRDDKSKGLIKGTYHKYIKGHTRKNLVLTLEARLRKYTQRNENGCLEWTGLKSKGGYGKATHKYETKLVHRWVWEEAHGPIPPGLFVCHRCDNPACVELAHLFLGTPQDNTDDMVAKKRYSTNNAKLTREQVAEIRSRLGPRNKTQLAREFNISKTQIQRIARNETWADVAAIAVKP